MNVQVAANTRVTVTFDASIDVATTVGLDAAGNAERAMGRILMAFDGLDADGAWVIDEQFQELVAGYRVDNAGNVLGDTLHWDGQLSVSFANWTGSDTVATLYSEGVIGGSSVVSAVPEPATYGMLLGGLALLGVAARRKKAAC
ncbi:PEP-CTERM sorting domain-containing protein [Pseudoduganella lutea]|uniref:PEP-CTERM sorting domain-containing protein n=2 Tax=Pseudoduganella lutea TaxID=321985 RepID=A0A4P6L871_9BURK|nr:PEP-CTERM sorting domain-containing protein [Pseudoduganella lutea]